MSFVAAGVGVALVPASARQMSVTGAVYRPLAGAVHVVELAMCWRAASGSATLPRALEVIRDELAALRGALPGGVRGADPRTPRPDGPRRSAVRPTALPSLRPSRLAVLARLRSHGAMSHAVRPIRVLAAADGTLAHMRAALAGCADLDLTTRRPARRRPPRARPRRPGAIRAILHRSPATNVVVLASDVDREHILDAIAAGAGGYLLADDDPSRLPDAIRAAARGESPLAPRAARALISGRPLPRRDARLPAVEKRVLGLLARGCPDEVIAERLGFERPSSTARARRS